MFYYGAQVIVFLFDVTDLTSFIYAKRLIEEITPLVQNSSAMALVGTKIDKKEERQVEEEEVRMWTESKDLFFMEVSAKECDVLETKGNKLNNKATGPCQGQNSRVRSLFVTLATMGLKKLNTER